jgi:hypothetical protein
MNTRHLTIIAGVLFLGLGMPLGANAVPTSYGPTHYSSFAADSPFKSVSFSYFFLEDFDDHLLNTPGVSVSPAAVKTSANSGFNGSIIDQVGLEGGCPPGGLAVPCDTLFGDGPTGLTFTFSAGVLGSLPTHAGVVWTDGAGTTSFQAFAADGLTVLCSIAPVAIADGSFFGTQGVSRRSSSATPPAGSRLTTCSTAGAERQRPVSLSHRPCSSWALACLD